MLEHARIYTLVITRLFNNAQLLKNIPLLQLPLLSYQNYLIVGTKTVIMLLTISYVSEATVF